MAQFRGTVRCVSVNEDSAFTRLEDATGDTETFILWFLPGTGGGIPRQLNSFTRVLHSMWVSLLREAHAGNLNITIIHQNGSAAIDGVQLGGL